MAQIPEYQRRELESSVVGTPGVDDSAARGLSSISKSLQQTSAAAFDLAARRKEAKDAALTNEALIGLDFDLANEYNAHQGEFKSFQGAPKERAEMFRARAQRLFDAKLSTIQDDNVRRQVAAKGAERLHSYTMQELKAADVNQGVLAYESYLRTQDTLARRAAGYASNRELSILEKREGLKQLLADAEKTRTVADKVFSTEQSAKLAVESPRAIQRGMALLLAAENPAQFLEMEKSGDFDKIEPDEIAQLRKTALKNASNIAEKAELDFYESNISGLVDVTQKWSRGEKAEAFAALDTMPQNDYTQKLRQSLLTEVIDPSENAAKAVELTLRADVLDKSRTKKDGKAGPVKASYEQILSFYSDVVEAHATGAISSQRRDALISKYGGDMFKKVSGLRVGVKSDNAFVNIVASVTKAFKNGRKGITDEDTLAFIDDFEKELTRSGKLDETSVARAVATAQRNHLTKYYPKLVGVQGVPNGVVDANGDFVPGVVGESSTPTVGKVSNPATPDDLIEYNVRGQRYQVPKSRAAEFERDMGLGNG